MPYSCKSVGAGDDSRHDDPDRAFRRPDCAGQIQIGTDMLFEQIPLYLEFFGFGKVTPDELRAVAMLA
jgi:hypothetical protein